MSPEAMYDAQFDNIAECVAYLRKRFPRKCLPEGRDIDTGETFRGGRFPRYLFRGEARCYPVSRPSLWRLRNEGQPFVSEVERATDFAHRHTARHLVLPYIEDLDHFTSLEWMAASATYEALAFCQHYGLPTAFMDFTSSLNVAATFASASACTDDQPWARIAVLDCGIAGSKSQVIDLRFFSATRAARQRGFALYVPGHADLCESATCASLGLRWFRFRRDHASESYWRRGYAALLRTADDRLAGWLRHAISMYVRGAGPLGTATAEYLSKRVPMVPLVAKRGAKTGFFSFQRPDAVSFDCAIECRRSLRDWSRPRAARQGVRHRMFRGGPDPGLVRFTGT